jgi:hypothetical protein
MPYIKVLKAPNYGGQWEDVEHIVKCKDCGEYPTMLMLENGKCRIGCTRIFMKEDTPIHDSAAAAITWWIAKNTQKNEVNTEKPPLGVKPSWLQAEQRIKELASAIERNAEKKNVNKLRVWIEELGYQCDILSM